MPRAKDRTARNKRQFLDAIARGYTVTDAAEAASVVRSTPYQWERDDGAFSRDWAFVRESRFRQWIDTASDLAVNGSETMLRFLINRQDRQELAADKNSVKPITEVIISTEDATSDDAAADPQPFFSFV